MVKKMYPDIEGPFKFDEDIFIDFSNVRGIYIIAIAGREYQIPYPRGKHNTIYVGQSRNIGKRLSQHATWNSINKNWGLYNYLEEYPVNIYVKELHGNSSLRKHENKMILDFEDKYGCAPICNMKTGKPK